MTREKGIRNSKEGGRRGSSEKREEKRVVRLLQNIRGWIWHILWQSVGFSRMARGRTNLDGYLLTHTAFCYHTELSLACTRIRKYNLRQPSSSGSLPLISTLSTVLYCIKAAARVAAWQKQAHDLPRRALGLLFHPSSLFPSSPRNPPTAWLAQHPVVL